MNLIVAAAQDWAIGNEGGLLWHLPEDMRFFKRMTTGNVIIIGRKTLESFPGGRPLKDRINVVVSRNEGLEVPGAQVVHSVSEAVMFCSQFEQERVFAAGGGHIYKEMLPYCDTAYVTRVYAMFKADTYFPDLDADPHWEVADPGVTKEHEGLSYAFMTYKRKEW